SLPPSTLKPLSPLITTLLADLLPSRPESAPIQSTTSKSVKNIPSLTTHHADSFLASSSPCLSSHTPPLHASTLLPLLITPLPPLRSELRTAVDRNAVLTANRDAQLASVLVPLKYARASLMPFLQGWSGEL